MRIACNEKGSGQFFGLSPSNPHNSDVLLRIVEEICPDIVHVQYEPGLYGLLLDPINPKNTNTNIDLFYDKCEVFNGYHISFCIYFQAVAESSSTVRRS